jgi:hypothetical protein
VLPHALANRLAAWALDRTPYDLIDQQLVTDGTDRLARSFSRRLSFLPDHPRAGAIVEKWLAADGLLGDVTTLSDLGRAMFENVAPVLPEEALAALERVGSCDAEAATTVWGRHLPLLRSLAYDPPRFERSAHLLARTATESTNERDSKEASDTFVSLFTIHLSGTHATIEQRLCLIDRFLRSGEAKQRSLGLAALDSVLEATHLSSIHQFDFGARSRDYGYYPRTDADVTRWFGATLALIERLALTEGVLKPELGALLARDFRGLWTSAQMYDELEWLSRRFAANGFWREGWTACRETMLFDKNRLTPEAISRLSALEADLRPSNLPERVRAVVLGDRSGGLDLEDIDIDDGAGAADRLEAIARELGAAVAADDVALAELLPDLVRGGNRAWDFGRGLANASPDLRITWAKLVETLEQVPLEQRDVRVLSGFLAELWDRDRELAQSLLDSALNQPALVVFLPALHSAAALDERGMERLKRALTSRQVPIWMYRNLALGRRPDRLAGGDLRELLLLITEQPDGFDVASEILYMRFFLDRSVQREHKPELLEAGRELLKRVTFRKSNHQSDYHLGGIVKTCLTGSDTGPIAAGIAERLRRAATARETRPVDSDDLLKALLEVQPAAALDALFAGNERDDRAIVGVFDQLGRHRTNPADAISCEALIVWCERDRERRYPLAASIITFARRSEESGPQIWSEQAKALFASAPDARSILKVFIGRFRPMSWSGSRAVLIEANARLLDDLEPHVSSDLMPFVSEVKAELVREVARLRRCETEEDRAQDEKFE